MLNHIAEYFAAVSLVIALTTLATTSVFMWKTSKAAKLLHKGSLSDADLSRVFKLLGQARTGKSKSQTERTQEAAA